MATRLIDLADANGDGRVSRDETQGLASFLVGGFFFRADGNGDGTVTPEEGRQARVELMNQHPAVASLLRSVRSATGQSPFATVASLVDVDYGKPLTMAEAREAARTAVNDVYGMADADKDGVITLSEAKSVAWQGARALGQAAFQAADNDRDGRLSQAEYDAAVQAAGRAAFGLADADKNNHLSQDEAAAAMGQLVKTLGIQSPSG